MKKLVPAIAALLILGSPAMAEQSKIHQIVTAKAAEHGVPSKRAHAVVKAESNYNCRAKNPASSASGAMQVLKRTARSVGVTGNLFDCRTGVEAGMRYLKIAYRKAGGNWCGAATLYNRGVGAKPSSSGYCRKILRLAK